MGSRSGLVASRVMLVDENSLSTVALTRVYKQSNGTKLINAGKSSLISAVKHIFLGAILCNRKQSRPSYLALATYTRTDTAIYF